MFIAAASVSYIAPFTGTYWHYLIKDWIQQCKDLGIPISDNYSLVNIFGDSRDIWTWNLNSLPSDSVSIDNAIIATST